MIMSIIKHKHQVPAINGFHVAIIAFICCILTVQKVTNKLIFVVLPCVVIGCGLAHHDTGFILVQETCPMSSFSRSVWGI